MVLLFVWRLSWQILILSSCGAAFPCSRTGETGATAERMQGGMSDQGGGVSGVSDVQQGED